MKTISKLTFVLFFATIIASFGFKTEQKDYEDFYIYVYTHDKSDYDKVYVSGMIHYQSASCGKTYDWQPKVEKAFKNYLKSEHKIDYDHIYVIGSTTGNYLTSTQAAKDAFNKWNAKNDSHSVTKTLFNYDCN
jgi:hypothetical protein